MNVIMLKRYKQQKAQANMRKIPFLLSFDEWSKIWLDSGKWEQRGIRKDQYVMSRYGDIGPYAIDNVFIQLSSSNVADAATGRIKTQEEIDKRSAKLKGRTISEEQKQKTSTTRKKQFEDGSISIWNKGKTGLQEAWNKGMKFEKEQHSNYGKKWYTNGETNVICFPNEIPCNFYPGKVEKSQSKSKEEHGSYGKKWYTDGTKNVMCYPNEQPDNFYPGKIQKRKPQQINQGE